MALVDDAAMRRAQHGRYLGSPTPTDVLAFELAGPGPVPLLGEVVVSARDGGAAGPTAAACRSPSSWTCSSCTGCSTWSATTTARPPPARRMHERARQILRRPVAARAPAAALDRTSS